MIDKVVFNIAAFSMLVAFMSKEGRPISGTRLLVCAAGWIVGYWISKILMKQP